MDTGPVPPPSQPQMSSAGKVSKACQRCRRHKSRCDLFRPCTLCVRADAECISDPDSTRPRAKRQKLSVSSSTSRQPRDRTAEPRPSADVTGTPSARDVPEVVDHPAAPTPASAQDVSQVDDYGEADSTMGITRRIFQLGSRDMDLRLTSAIPDGENLARAAPHAATDQTRHVRPVSHILGYSLPSRPVVDFLLEEYFERVHWFSLVIYEPLFRKEYDSVADGLASPEQKGFLTLLTMVVGLAAWYRSQRNAVEEAFLAEDFRAWSSELLRQTELRLFDLMDDSDLTSVQVCILLGSYGVYHGKPNVSFALLGASIKMAQALRLHREPSRGDPGEIEERKRVWWTIYTWDRFASITYGRPLGINEKDCNVSMPADVLESPCFRYNSSDGGGTLIHYSAYQRELNTLYQIASPMIEAIFGTRGGEAASRRDRSNVVAEIDQQLRDWHQRLPAHLVLDLNNDTHVDTLAEARAHRLQALSLQLTYDNIVIVLHRPFFAQQVNYLTRVLPVNLQGSTPGSTLHVADTPQPMAMPGGFNSETWWNAAVRTSRVTELPNLAQLATETHLVAFMAINLFNAAIVMVVCALSDPLSDRAQEAKRNITRIYRLQELLGYRSKLPMQSSVILQDVIRVLLNREAEAMLTSVVGLPAAGGKGGDQRPGLGPSGQSGGEGRWPASQQQQDSLGMAALGRSRTVEDTLRLPLDIPAGAVVDSAGAVGDPQAEHLREAARLNGGLAYVQRVLPNGRAESLSSAASQMGQGRQDLLQGEFDSHVPGQRDPVVYGGMGSPLGTALHGEKDLYWIWSSVADWP
ncbi:c6 transcription factor [Diplodia corticola]|uniref:C6 transcription factor n=1 Tax=Diplodia corticola TaxID=236234 RepID=A0A1J9SBP1_9PEZI|nr:c6 transcription factor [Diplodia corticola]OJD37895.1 c6 transcription factor [Diplodia corticola]